MEMSSLNYKHEQILTKYVKFIQGTVYRATEDFDNKKFLDFNEILENIVKYTNAFNQVVKTPNKRAEWAYMTPNLMMYATMGFLSGIKMKENGNYIDELSELMFERTVEFIGETTDILEDIKIKEKIQDEILNLTNNNEHNN
tara:strand:- start:13404 stop:13829 length:426 start_codon:yes stop_codon:yes gene_type:complete